MPSAARIAVLAAAIAVTAVVVILSSGGDDSAGPERGVTLADVLGEPERYLGQQVTVSGEVARLAVARGAFTIGDRVSPREDDLIVVPPPSGRSDPGELDEGSIVRVRGTVRRAATRSDDEDLLFEDEEDDALDEFEGEVAIDATRVDVLRP
jgi:hypothetical protein